MNINMKWMIDFEQLMDIPIDRHDLEEKYEHFLEAADECCEDSEYYIAEQLIDYWKRSHLYRLQSLHVPQDNIIYLKEIQDNLQQLISRKQITQRTEEWYAHANTVLTASEFSTILKKGITRGKLVLKKAAACAPEFNQQLAIPSDKMTPFDWGIRFEPVIKRLYEIIHNCHILELGRITHPTDNRVAASPDGIIDDASDNSYIGRLVEFKCPVSRDITDKVPEDYYVQMQIQCEVTQSARCDYVEAQFRSVYNNHIQGPSGPTAFFYGTIWLAESENNGMYSRRYIYGEPRRTNITYLLTDYPPDLSDNENIIETIPWELMCYSEILVERDTEWYNTVAFPAMNEFWVDVAAAKKGEFVLPDSKRKKKSPAADTLENNNTCLIIEEANE